MSVYHITYTPEKQHVYLFMDNGCNFNCHGCITDKHPADYHLESNKSNLDVELGEEHQVIDKINGLQVQKVTWLGKEPTCDPLFHKLTRRFKKSFGSYNILITNAFQHPGSSTDWLDEVCVSVKAITPGVFRIFTGQKHPEIVLEHLSGLAQNTPLSLRTESVLVPGLIGVDEIALIASEIAKVGKSITYRIDGYIPYGTSDIYRKPEQAEMKEAKQRAEVFLNEVNLLHFNKKPSQTVEVIY